MESDKIPCLKIIIVFFIYMPLLKDTLIKAPFTLSTFIKHIVQIFDQLTGAAASTGQYCT